MKSYDIPLALTYDDVLLLPQKSRVLSRSLVNLDTYITPNVKIKFPIISINMQDVTGIKMAVAMAKYGGTSFYPRFKSPKEQANEVKKVLDKGFLTVPAIGIKETDFERVEELSKIGCKVLTIDVAHGYLETVLDMVTNIKKKFKKMEVIAGVIADYEGAKNLFKSGADAVRVGLGPGTICTTRQLTGTGVPQITATLEAKRAGKEFNRPVITDGGAKNSGDITKALGAGASAVVVGSILAGTEESPGKLAEIDGRMYKAYNAATSYTEKKRQIKQFSKNKNADFIKYVEGVESVVPYKGPVKHVLDQLEKGIKSGFSYSNALTVEDMHKNAKFVRVTPISVSENGAHGVITTVSK